MNCWADAAAIFLEENFMTTKEQKAISAPKTGAANSELAGLIEDFSKLNADLKGRFKTQEDRLNMLEKKHSANRPILSQAAEVEAPHQKAFAAYLRSGDDDAMRSLEVEEKALSISIAADGGYLVDPQTANQIASVLKSTSSIRAIANVVAVEATAYDVLIDTAEAGAGWATETDPTTETGTPVIERISIPLHELSALPKASQRLLDDSAFDVEGWLAGRIADKFARAEGEAFISGDGIDKPKGFLTYTTVDNGSENWGDWAMFLLALMVISMA